MIVAAYGVGYYMASDGNVYQFDLSNGNANASRTITASATGGVAPTFELTPRFFEPNPTAVQAGAPPVSIVGNAVKTTAPAAADTKEFCIPWAASSTGT